MCGFGTNPPTDAVQDAAFVIALPELGGVARLEALGLNLFSLVEYQGE